MNQQTTCVAAGPYAGFPAEPKALPQWAVWKYEARKNGKGKRVRTEVLFDSQSRQHDSTTNSGTWASFETAFGVAGQYDGIGFDLAPPFVVIDLDKVKNQQTGQTEGWAAACPGQCHEVLCDPNVTPCEEDSRHVSSY